MVLKSFIDSGNRSNIDRENMTPAENAIVFRIKLFIFFFLISISVAPIKVDSPAIDDIIKATVVLFIIFSPFKIGYI